ncbi:class I SAM-dependent methyltransferase [Methylocystis parvus]|uniref:Methyltransferase domain-containing protein n=1 Tax=Methylocystis parvus TaxID=134 RepID=A0A6B8M676_9HYPH|nr:rRNA adenine N-6-methyltransferase family protein [Methylocystis parvus]QGM97968.1 methyltransferase domain-containing protein [Methylocystis parvus]WBK01718.1 methyltransferase domain-containing protein [Methylocystis parvus OBBP]
MQNAKSSLADSARFIKQWIENPRLIGAVQPSGPALAKCMAGFVDLSRDGPIVELGPGTGPVTKALLARGVPPERLVLVEYETRFCHMLAERYPGVNVVQGDAYALKKTLDGKIDGQVAAIVSSLPLLVRPERDRVELLHQAFELMGDEGLYIQFTYGLAVSPMPIHAHGLSGSYVGKGSAPIIMNIPPARVWRYRKAGHGGKP